MKLLISIFVLLLALTGCQSYRIVQTNVFSDSDGNIVSIDFGNSDTEHTNTFISPFNGKEMEFKSRLVVKVATSDGERFTAWQCMNMMRTGTMYKTDNEKWMVLVNPFSCVVYRQLENDKTLYREVYRGVLCDSQTVESEPDKYRKERVLPRTQGRPRQ